MKMSARRLYVVIIAAAMLIIAAALIATGNSASPTADPQPSPDGPQSASSSDCGTLAALIPDDSLSTVLDVSNETLEISWWDGLLQSDRMIVVSYQDPVCLAHPKLGPIIEHELEHYEEGLAGVCPSLRDAVAQGHAHKNGADLDIAEAQDYIDKRCVPRGL